MKSASFSMASDASDALMDDFDENERAKEDNVMLIKKLQFHENNVNDIESKADASETSKKKKKKKKTTNEKWFGFAGHYVVHTYANAINQAEKMKTTFHVAQAAGNIAGFFDQVSSAPRITRFP